MPIYEPLENNIEASPLIVWKTKIYSMQTEVLHVFLGSGNTKQILFFYRTQFPVSTYRLFLWWVK